MNEEIDDAQIQAALDRCAEEPVHIPGTIQPFGWLVGYDLQTGDIQYASDNFVELLDLPLQSILSRHIRDIFGREIWHSLKNMLATPDAATRRRPIGLWRPNDKQVEVIVSAWTSNDHAVLELELQSEEHLLSAERMHEQTMLTSQVLTSETVETLLDVSTRQLRHLTGFDRVMVYRFDQVWNGSVIAESRTPVVEPFLGLNFPSFDIPSQARDIMARIPLRIIADVDQKCVPISTSDPEARPLDISLGETRGTAAVHIQYLKNMGVRSTMTLSIVVGDVLWGIISFHHRSARVTPLGTRNILKNFLEMFCLKLGLLQEKRLLQLTYEIDEIHHGMQSLISTEPDIGQILKAMGTQLCETFQACGILIRSEDTDYAHGIVPNARVIDSIVANVISSDESPYFSDNLSVSLPSAEEELGVVAGVAAVCHSNNWVLLVFREGLTQQTQWAGDPQKNIEFVEGNARLTPRGSFSTFLATVQGQSAKWSMEDATLFKRLWPLLSSALNTEAKQRFMRDLNRQRELMIDELNHRVRNILALVQAVSKEAKKSESSLESYSKAIEARIRALAAAHTIGSGTSTKQVDIIDIIAQEARPYQSVKASRVRVSGIAAAINPEMAPIFALTIHELMTNAAKYGALSAGDGIIEVAFAHTAQGLEMNWTERGGPLVSKVRREGFGTTLILRAVPFEMGGESSLEFLEAGVQARIMLPFDVLARASSSEARSIEPTRFDQMELPEPQIPDDFKAGLTLILEDNYMISETLAQHLRELGFSNIETMSSSESAMELIEASPPRLAILDVNLGAGKTSEAVAEALLDMHVPLIFVTGYGELSNMSPRLSKLIVLTKPVSTSELAHAIERVSTG